MEPSVEPGRPSQRKMAYVPADHAVAAEEPAPVVLDLEKLEVHYGAFRAVRDVTLQIRKNEITAFIGPSGCGKTTVLRCLNRMNDLIAGARVGGKVTYRGVDLYGPEVAVTEVRRHVGMVFQKPN